MPEALILLDAARIIRTMPEVGLRGALRYARFRSDGLGIHRLFATLPRSGYNYLATLLSVAVDLREGGAGGYAWQGGRWVHDREIFCACDRRTPLGERTGKAGRVHDFRTMPLDEVRTGTFIYHTHEPYEDLEPRSKGTWRTVVLARDPFDQIESQIAHQKYGSDRQVDFLVDGFLKSNVAFLNSWGRQLQRRDDVIAFRYAEVVGPGNVAKIAAIADFLSLNLDLVHIERAADATSKHRMLEMIPADERAHNKRVTETPKVSLNDLVRDYVRRYLDQHLREGRMLLEGNAP